MKIENGLPVFARVNDRLAKIAWDLSRARKIRSKRDNAANEEMLEVYDDTIGRSLHNIYSGIKGMLHDFAAEIDEALPKSQKLLTDLLRQMTTATASRPAVMQHSDELRAFSLSSRVQEHLRRDDEASLVAGVAQRRGEAGQSRHRGGARCHEGLPRM